MKILLGVLAATIRGSLRSRVRLRADSEVPIRPRRHQPAGVEYTNFSCYGVSPAHDDSDGFRRERTIRSFVRLRATQFAEG